MDYPAPRIGLTDGRPDITDAYGVGVGAWDKFAVDWLYGAGSEAEAAETMQARIASGLRFVSDADSRGNSAAQPLGSLWDDQADPAAELARMMTVRRAALDQFGPGAIAAGQPVSQLRRAFVPIWLLHRYQIEAAVKLLGGVNYSYALNGDGTEAAKPVPASAQRAALDALLGTLSNEALTVPAGALPYLSAGYPGSNDRQTAIEVMPTLGGAVFDPLAATEIGALVALEPMFDPARLARLDLQHGADGNVPGALQTVDAVFDRTFSFSGLDQAAEARQRRIATVSALALARTALGDAASPALAAILQNRLATLADELAGAKGSDEQARWSRGFADLLRDRDRLIAATKDRDALPEIPPGMPIGSE
jgi:hypothetical protein